ncbi:hypothetical protein ACJX0J_021433, partial [Zea mays]
NNRKTETPCIHECDLNTIIWMILMLFFVQIALVHALHLIKPVFSHVYSEPVFNFHAYEEFKSYHALWAMCLLPHIFDLPDWQEKQPFEDPSTIDEGSESETEDEGDEDWKSNNEKYDESNDEDALNLENYIEPPGHFESR